MKSINQSQQVYINKPRSAIFLDNLTGGIAWGVGTVLGALILFSVLGFIAARIHTVPIIGEFVYNVITEVQKLQGK